VLTLLISILLCDYSVSSPSGAGPLAPSVYAYLPMPLGARAADTSPEQTIYKRGEPEVNIIQVTRGGMDITLYGQLSLDELQKVAESIS